MELKVVWTSRAENNYLKILDYIVDKFGKTTGTKYNEKLFELIRLIRAYPAIGTKQAKGKNIRAIILFKRTTVFYIERNETIRIINIIDNRWEF